MKLISILIYDINLKDWDIDNINKVAQTFDKVSKGIYLWLYHLLSNKPEEIQWFQDIRF